MQYVPKNKEATHSLKANVDQRASSDTSRNVEKKSPTIVVTQPSVHKKKSTPRMKEEGHLSFEPASLDTHDRLSKPHFQEDKSNRHLTPYYQSKEKRSAVSESGHSEPRVTHTDSSRLHSDSSSPSSKHVGTKSNTRQLLKYRPKVQASGKQKDVEEDEDLQSDDKSFTAPAKADKRGGLDAGGSDEFVEHLVSGLLARVNQSFKPDRHNRLQYLKPEKRAQYYAQNGL